jgi:DUF971 family protein
MALALQNIQVIGSELAICWNDGTESFIDLERMRRACPCAGCGGEPDVLGRVIRPDVSYSPSSFGVRKFEVIGGYAVQPVWTDGHQTGIYPFGYLRKLAT